MVERKQGEFAPVPGCQGSPTPLAFCSPHLRVTSRSREPGSEPAKLFVAPQEQSLSEDLTAGLSEATAQAHFLTLGLQNMLADLPCGLGSSLAATVRMDSVHLTF